MANYDGDVQLTVNLTPGDVIQSAEKISKDIEKTFTKSSGKKVSPQFKSILSSLNQIHGKIGQVRSRMQELEGTKLPTEQYTALENKIETTEKALSKSLDTAHKYSEQLAEMRKKVPTQEYKDISKVVETLQGKLENALEKQARFLATGGKESSRTYKGMVYDVAQLEYKLNAAETAMKNLEASGKAFTFNMKPGEYDAVNEKLQAERENIENLEGEYGQLLERRQEMEDSGLAYVAGEETEEYQNLTGTLNGLVNSATAFLSRLYALKEIDFSSAIVKGFKLIISLGGKVAGILLKIAGHAKDAAISLAKMAGTSIKNKLKDLAKSMLGLNRNAKGTNDVLKGGFRMFLRYGLGIRSVYFLFRRLRKALTEGIENLAQYSGAFNTSMSAMKSALTRLKNSFATAFAPLIEQVAPILVYVANLISEVVTRIGMLIATLTGKNSFTRAKAVTEDYAKSLKSASSATDKNKESTDKLKESWEEYKKTLAGFDDVEILKDMNKDDDNGNGAGSGSGSGSGNNGGYTGPTPEEMFEEVPIAQGLKDLAERIKEAWRTADFTDLGTMVGEKLKDALENIPWDIIKATLNKIAKSIATFLNGFLETPGLFTVIGETIAEALNTAFGAVYTFAKNFHWDSLGKAIADGINGFFKTFNFKLAADTFSELAKGILDTIINALENVNWQTVGNKVQEFLTNVDWPGILEKVGEAAGAAVGAIAGFVAGLFKGVPEAVKKWWEENALDDEGEFVIEGFFNGIVNALADIKDWLYKHLVQPFIKGFKDAFGISSPAKEMEEPGQFVFEGILQGILNAIKGIKDWIAKNVLKPIQDAIGIPIIAVQVAVQKAAEWAKDAWTAAQMAGETVVHTLKTVVDKGKTWIADAWSAAQKAKETITRTLEQVVKSGKWSDAAWSAAKKVKETVSRTLEQVVKAGKWSDSAWSAAKKAKDTIKRVLEQTVKSGSWSDNAWSAAKKAKDTVKRILEQTVKSGSWSDAAWAAAQKAKNTIKRILEQTVKQGSWNKDAWAAAQKAGGTIKRTLKMAVTGAGNAAKAFLKWLTGGKKAKGGIYTARGGWKDLPQFASGGIIKQGIQYFAQGGLPNFGSLFVAGEAGPEIVGNINGRTEILNKSQIASAIYSAVLKGMNTAVNSFGTFISAKLAESTNANLAAIQAGVLAIQNIADQNIIPAITSGRVIPYSMLANTEKQTTTLEEIRELLKNNQNSLTYNELYSIIEDVVRKYMNIQFYIGDEQVARHANAGNAKIERRLNPVAR